MNPSIQGAFKSVTIWAAAAIAVLSNVAPLVPSLCAALKLDPATTQAVGSVISVVMVVCRTITKGSLADKVAADSLPAPTAASVSPPTQGTK